MKSITRFIPLLTVYRVPIILSIICQIGVAVFTVASIPAFIPFIRVIFGLDKGEPSEHSSGFMAYIQSGIAEWTQGKSQLESLAYICGLLIIIFLIKNIFRYGASYFLAPVRTGVIKNLRGQVYTRLMNTTIDYQQRQKRGDVLSRLSADVAEVEWSIMNTLEVVFRQPIVILGCLVFMVYVSPSLTAIVLICMMVLATLLGIINRRLRKSSGDTQELQGSLLSRVDETLDGARVIRAYGSQDTIKAKFRTINNRYAQSLMGVLQRRDLASPLSEFLGVSIFALVLWIGSRSVFSGEIGAETFFAFLIAFFYIIEPAKALAQAQSHISKGLGALDRLDELIAAPQEMNRGTIVVTEFTNDLVINQVSFRYSEAQEDALQDIFLKIKKGEHLALVGASGSGKSTVADLILRYFEPVNGTIELDGISSSDITINSWRSLFGLVTQDPILFNASIAENISMFSEQYSQDQIITAAQQAYAHDFISDLPDGYNTILDDRGRNLSGGERQRIALARAILSDAPILVLDEATSALDSRSEKYIQQALTGVLRNRTAIIIAHRESTIQHCDQVVELVEGRVRTSKT